MTDCCTLQRRDDASATTTHGRRGGSRRSGARVLGVWRRAAAPCGAHREAAPARRLACERTALRRRKQKKRYRNTSKHAQTTDRRNGPASNAFLATWRTASNKQTNKHADGVGRSRA
jgi:hypothetical protein